ncbi:prepilin-type N-terminal cleavage/methylation domain-containing protein [Candidatus Microgenomates bacterium]|nr:MAG: prepilin-type N-terminal cleavage/methylation domain-containing protein [Candidatus Microgenomates bacterium]
MNTENSGFTLIEMLVVVVIIGVVVTAGTFGFKSVRQGARDDARRAGLATVQSILSRYRADCNRFPSVSNWNSWVSSGGQVTGDNSGNTCRSTDIFVDKIPRDPMYPTRTYSYSLNGNLSYTLCASLETPPSPAMDTTTCGSCGSAACNFILEND